MGTFKKEASRKARQGKTTDGMANVKTKGENFYRYGRIYYFTMLIADILEVLQRKPKH
jgi:hypothetical protein